MAAAGAGMNLIQGNRAANESAAQMNKYREALDADKAAAKAKEQYYENVSPLDTKTGKAMSTEMAQQLADVNAAAAGRNAVGGGQGFNTAATKNATSQLMAEYQRSLIKQHESNVVPQLNYYRSLYNNANAASQKAQYDQAMAGIQAASQAWQGVGAALNAGGSALMQGAMLNDGNGTKTGAGSAATNNVLANASQFNPNAVNGAVDKFAQLGKQYQTMQDTYTVDPSYLATIEPMFGRKF